MSLWSTKIKWKTNILSLDLAQKIKIWTSQKSHACILGGNIFYRYYQKMRKGEFFKLVIIRIEKLVFELQKNLKKTPLYLD